MKKKPDLTIIGGGLSGLYAAYLLQDLFNVTVLEARDRLGGRVLTHQGHDLGPSWIWPHQQHIRALIQELGLTLFSQYTHGYAIYDAPQGVQRFQAPPTGESFRLKGGLDKLVSSLAARLSRTEIQLNSEVLSLDYTHPKISIKTLDHSYKCDYLLCALPPRLALENIIYHPKLTHNIQESMKKTPTWMGYSRKCVIEFKEAFWRMEGLSGFVYSPLGPLSEVHDACTEKKAALFGFVHSNFSTPDLETAVKQQIARIFPDRINDITAIHCLDWRAESFSSTQEDHKGLSTHPQYGLDLHHFDGRLIFIGTETAYDEGGYLEGALNSAQDAANRLRSIVF